MADCPAPADRDLSEGEAAAALQVHPKTLARWRRAREVAHYVTPGGRVRYRFEDLITFRASMRVARVLPNAPKCSDMSGDSGD